MFAGLIFATEEAEGSPQLAATLPFGGLTLVEFQARLLAAAGASQLVLVVGRMTPELLGATNRIGRRGTAVDMARTAREALEKLHPLARVLVVADGVVTSGETLRAVLAEPGEALLVTDDAGVGSERIGAFAVWAGVALVDRARLEEVAAMPADYDLRSSLLRAAAQSGAAQLRLSEEGAAGHRVERNPVALATMGDALVAASIPAPVRWADRVILRQATRLVLPMLIQRETPTPLIATVAGLLCVMALVLAAIGWSFTAMLVLLPGTMALAIGHALGWLRDDVTVASGCRAAIALVMALAVLLVARSTSDAAGSGTALVVALGGIAAAALVERIARPTLNRWWWGSPVSYVLLLLPFLLIGQPLLGLVAGALYALATLVAAVEGLLAKP